MARAWQVGGMEVLELMDKCAGGEEDGGKPTHTVVIADCGVCGLNEPELTAWVKRPDAKS